MDGKKVYSIQINGVKESTDAVLALNRMLNELETRMQALEKKNIKISGDKSNASDLQEQVALQKELNQLKKEEAAQQRLAADAYANTMKGMKQNLADLKTVINATDLGETDSIKNMTKDAGELTKKLKEMEEAYGQFGRNVGNYKSAADGFKKLTLEVNGVSRSFDNARQALKTLKNERDTLALSGGRATEQFKELDETVKQLQSDIQDMSKSSAAMDNLLDTMEGFTAIGSVSQGFSALFGFDDSEIQRSIQRLVALQNILKGIEVINKQIQTGEGVGGWIRPFANQVDLATAKLLKFNTALLGTGTASKVASKGIKALGMAIKGLATLGIMVVFDLLMEGLDKLIEKFKEGDKELEKQKQYIESTQGAYAKASAEIQNYNSRLQSFNGTQKQENALVEELNNKFGKQLGTYKTLAQWKDVLSKKGEAYAKTMLQEAEAQALLNMYTEAYIELQKVQAAVASGEYHHWYQTAAGDREADAKAIAEAQKKLTEAQQKYQDKMKEIEEHNKKNSLMNYAPQIKKDGKKSVDAVKEVEKEMYAARLSLMKEGLNKTITQLEEERKQRLAKIRSMGKSYKEEEAEINRIYNERIAEATKDWTEKIEKIYKDMWDKIYADALDNTKRTTKMAKEAIDIMNQNLKDTSNEYFNQSIGSYGIQGKKQLTPTTQFSLGIASENKSELMTEMKEYVDMMRELQTVQNEYNATYHKLTDDFNKLSDEKKGQLNMDLDMTQNYFNKLKKEVDEYESYLKEKYSEDVFQGAKVALFNESYSSDLTSLFEQRISAIEAYWAKRKKYEAENANELYNQQKKELDEEWKAESAATWNHYQEELKQADDFYEKKLDLIKAKEKNGIITKTEAEEERRGLEAEYQKASTQMYQNYAYKDEQLRIMHSNNTVKLEQEKNNKLKQTNAEYYQSALQELRDFQTAQSNLENKQPVKNAWGITNFKETNANYRNLLSAYESMADKIIKKRAEINADYKSGVIDKDTFDSTIRELDNFSADLGEKMDNVKKKLKVSNQIGEFIQDIQQYVQVLGQSIQQIMSAVWDYQDYMFDKEQDELDKWNEKLDKALDEQQEIVEEHKNNIDSIEDELATARGDRRQHLIDQLNAEIAAQRAAQKEEQRIKKEQEQAKKKEEALEKKRRQEEYERNVMQAFISWHLSIANGLATQPFMPLGIAMGALATVLGAAQYALVKSQKPYAKGGQLDGGVAQGKRHRDGGIPVLGGRASIEGGEFITNRQTTANNVDLLEFVNSKHRKLNIDDFIDFYSSGKAKKNIISMSPRTKFADGGVVPTLDNTYSFDDRLLESFEKYSNRPVQVSVVDINNKQDDVKRVQALAGLDV